MFSSTSTEIITSHRLSHRVYLSLEMIHSSFKNKNLSAKTLKRGCEIHDNNFSSVFRREVGMTIKDYIEHLRIETACALLGEGSMTAVDVGYAVGYEHIQTFYRAFRRRMACTPRQYQQKLSGKDADC